MISKQTPFLFSIFLVNFLSSELVPFNKHAKFPALIKLMLSTFRTHICTWLQMWQITVYYYILDFSAIKFHKT